MAKDRATSVDFLDRVNRVRALLLQGHTRPQILRHALSAWNVGERQADNYIAEASKEIEAINLNSAERNMALVTSNLWRIYRKNLASSPGLARQALMDIAKLRGLEKEDITVTIRGHKDASDEEITKAAKGARG